MRRILAIGGFSTVESESIAAGYIRDLTAKARPKICLLSSPSGDVPRLIHDFDQLYGKLGFQTSNVPFFGPVGKNFVRPDDAPAHLLEQDAIFVSGGNARCALGLWKEWGLDAALREAWEHGVLLSGMSAGAICWFEHHVPTTVNIGRVSSRKRLLGLLPGGCSVHYHAGDGSSRKEVWNSMQMLEVPSAVAIDDDAAVLYEGNVITEVLTWRANATAYQLEFGPDGVTEHPLTPSVIGSLPTEPARVPISLDIESKRRCVGRYQLVDLMQATISLEGEQLFAQYGNQPKLEIFPESENGYFWKAIDAQITFERDLEGNVTSLVHHQNGRDIRGAKLTE